MDMKGLSFGFFALGVLSVLIGMVWGIQMAATHDHLLSPAHAHLNLLGWVSFSIYAFFYHLVPNAAQGMLPKVHFALALAGLVLIVPGIAMAHIGMNEGVAAAGSILSLLSMLVFGVIVLRRGRA
jgi:cbb3-type cytochrome oxidase subunit 1